MEKPLLIQNLVKQIVLYDDKAEIYYNTPIQKSPENNQGFLLCSKTIFLSSGYWKKDKHKINIEIYVWYTKW